MNDVKKVGGSLIGQTLIGYFVKHRTESPAGEYPDLVVAIVYYPLFFHGIEC